MSATTTPLADALLAGPRGRRMLLEYAVASAAAVDKEDPEDTLQWAVFHAGYHLDPAKGSARVLFGPGADESLRTVIAPEEVARQLERVELAEATPERVRSALAAGVDHARYWQEPDGEDVLAADPAVRAALRRVAELVAGSPSAAWWCTPAATESQWAVQWDDEELAAPEDVRAVLHANREHVIAMEQAARRERPEDPTANWSGEWWSLPTRLVPWSARELVDGSPAGLWFVEDSAGWDEAMTRPLVVPEGLRIYEVDSEDAWAALCRRFPLDVTAQQRHDWYRTTGRAGRWVVPDWAGVAEHFDAVHLQVGAYLAAAGTAIIVDAESASVIAGWDPDTTYWFTSRVRYGERPIRWRRTMPDGTPRWARAAASRG